MEDDANGVNIDFTAEKSLGSCPKCGGSVFEHGKDFVCEKSVVTGDVVQASCDFKLQQVVLTQPISREQCSKLLDSGKTDFLEGFISVRSNRSFRARIYWDVEAEKANFEFPDQQAPATSKSAKALKSIAPAKSKSAGAKQKAAHNWLSNCFSTTDKKIQTKSSRPSDEVLRLIADALATKRRVFDYLDAHPVDGSGADEVRGCLRFLEETYAAYAEPTPIETVDRTMSLFGGPLYVSARHPHPLGKLGNGMFPVLQINIAWLNAVCDRKFEPCLLQLWWDTERCTDHLRKIPLNDVVASELLAIQIAPDVQESGELWLPNEWNRRLTDDALQITMCIPTGASCPGTDLGRDFLSDEYGDNVDASFWEDLEKFSSFAGGFEVLPSSDSLLAGTFFGQFYSSQVSPGNFSHDGCLISFAWAMGFGTIFYDHDEVSGKTEFSFYGEGR